jgi:hypothetical protein
MNDAAAKSPKPLRMNQRAMLIPEARFAEWHRIASATAGLSELDHQVLDAIMGYYRLLHERGYASVPSIEQMAKSSGARSIDISGAIRHLVGLALLAVKPVLARGGMSTCSHFRSAPLHRWRPRPLMMRRRFRGEITWSR